ncbi:MAG: hypothetical protein LBI95_03375, partial [Holosporales bacterium]|nr:hypothetical protein [Holosporales bacterium]
HNIYFPADGSQPTTPEAVEYSCANIDNRENSPITEWYMQMFGVPTPFPGLIVGAQIPAAIVQAGWDAQANNLQPIISFDGSINNVDMVNDPNHGGQVSTINLFIRHFRKIASTSVGRVLLYRILIEIRRHNPGGNIGCCGADVILIAALPNTRNRNRSISIRLRSPFAYLENSSRININTDAGIAKRTVIGKRYDLCSYITMDTTSYDALIFHEMVHWYHHLRDPIRQNTEKDVSIVQIGNLAPYSYFWNGLNGVNDINRERLSIRAWRGAGADILKIEEIRTILGSLKNTINYLEGDDLSENLYYACIFKPLSFGHSRDETFYEDNMVIDKVITITNANIGYACYGENPIFRNKKTFDTKYRPSYSKQGLGECYYSRWITD